MEDSYNYNNSSNSSNSSSSLKSSDSIQLDNDLINNTNKQMISSDSNILLDYDSFLEYSSKNDNGILQDDIIDKNITNGKYYKIEKNYQLLERILYSVSDELNIDKDTINETMNDLNEVSTNNLIDILKSAIKNSNSKSFIDNSINNNDHTKTDFHKTNSSDWQEVIEWNPVPPFNLESPVIQHLLNTWTTDQNKIEYLHGWIKSLSQEDTTHKYPPGIQITSISNVLRDGIMLLLIPLIRESSVHSLSIFTRKYELFQSQQLQQPPSSSLRSRLSESNYIEDNEIDHYHIHHMKHIGSNNSTTTYNNNNNNDNNNNVFDNRSLSDGGTIVCNSDPFAHIGDIVYDVRIIRSSYTSCMNSNNNDYQHSHSQHMMMMSLENDSIHNNMYYHKSLTTRYKSDEQNYYSQLSEINKFLPVIEARMDKTIDSENNDRDYEESMISHIITNDTTSNTNNSNNTISTTTTNASFLDFLPTTWINWFGNSSTSDTINNSNDVNNNSNIDINNNNINNNNNNSNNIDDNKDIIIIKKDIVSPVNKIQEKLNRIRMKTSNTETDNLIIKQTKDQVKHTDNNNIINNIKDNNSNNVNSNNVNSNNNIINNSLLSEFNNLNNLPSIEEILQVSDYEHESTIELEASL